MNVERLKETEIYKAKLQIFYDRDKELTEIWREHLEKKSKKKYSAKNAITKHYTKLNNLLDVTDDNTWTNLELILLLEDLCGLLKNDKIGGKWAEAERELYDQNRTLSEGRGEKSLRSRLNLSIIPGSSSRVCDIPELGIEVKEWVQSHLGSKHNLKLETIRITKKTQSYSAVVYDIGVLDGKGSISLTDEQKRNIKRGELSLKAVKILPDIVVDMFKEYTVPDKVMSSYPKMACVSPTGFIMFDISEYNELWVLNQFTQGGPKYKAVRDYLLRKICQISDMLIEASSTQLQHPCPVGDPSQTSQSLPSEAPAA